MSEMMMENEKKNADLDLQLLKKRTLLLFGEIDDKKAAAVVSGMLYLAAADAEAPIKLYINSVGGDETEVMAIYDVMRSISCPVHTIALGKVHGNAVLLLAGGASGERSVYANCEVMLTQVSRDRTFAQASDIEIETAHLLEVKARLVKVLASLTGQNEERIYADIDRRRWLFADQTKEYGIADNIIG